MARAHHTIKGQPRRRHGRAPIRSLGRRQATLGQQLSSSRTLPHSLRIQLSTLWDSKQGVKSSIADKLKQSTDLYLWHCILEYLSQRTLRHGPSARQQHQPTIPEANHQGEMPVQERQPCRHQPACRQLGAGVGARFLAWTCEIGKL